MARKKASLGATHRRPPAVPAGSAGMAGAGAHQLVARRDVRRSGAPIAKRVAGTTVLQPVDASLHQGEADRGAIDAKLLQLVAPHSRVLAIGRDMWSLSRSFSSAGCRVSVVETGHDVPPGSPTFSDRVIVGDPDTLDLDATLNGAQFDAVVAVQLLEHARNPVSTLIALGKHLATNGCVVAAVPNVMHGSIRLGFLSGRSPAGLLAEDATPPSHWYDRATLQRTFDRAGFVITRLERHTEPFDCDAVMLDGAPLPAQVVDGLMRDADATTWTFVVVAHRLPLTGRVLLEMRMRELGKAHDSLLQHMKELADRADGLDTQYAGLKGALDGAVSTIDRIGSDVQLAAARDSQLQLALTTAHQRLIDERAALKSIDRDLKRFQYEQLIARVRATVEATLPSGAVALVVSKGDERLVDFRERTGWHFLRNSHGVYAGHHPADSAAAIEALERMRADGARYLVFPQVALWWLDHYAGFRAHLDRHCRIVFRDDRTAVIYALDKAETGR